MTRHVAWQMACTSDSDNNRRVYTAKFVTSEASVVMQRLSYLTETVLHNKITRNRIVPSAIIQRQSQKTTKTATSGVVRERETRHYAH